jgi:hypothetical protein
MAGVVEGDASAGATTPASESSGADRADNSEGSN